jgi:WD40 repeat protein
VAASLAALGFFIVAGSWLTSWWLAAERGKTQKNLTRALAAEKESREALWESLVDRARAGRWTGRAGQRVEGLSALSQAVAIGGELDLTDARKLRLRNEAIACLVQADLHPGATLKVDVVGAQYSGVSFDRELRRVAHPARGGGVLIRWLDGRSPDLKLQRVPGSGQVVLTRFSPDDRYLAVRSRGPDGGWRHSIYEVAAARHLFSTDAADSPAAASLNLDFSADGKHVVAAHRDGSLRWYELSNGREVRKLPREKAPRGIAACPVGDCVAVWRGTEVEVVDVAANKTRATFRTRNSRIHHVAWSRDGRFLAGGAADHSAYIWDVWGRAQHAILEGHQGHVVQVGFHPSGNLVATASLDGTTRLWDTWTGQEQVAALGSGVQFSSDGKRLAFGVLSDTVGWWHVGGGTERRTFHGDTKYEAYDVAAHPSRPIAATYGFKGIRIWDIEKGHQVAMLAGNWRGGQFDAHTGDLIASGEQGVYRVTLPPDLASSGGQIVELNHQPDAIYDQPASYTVFSTRGDVRLSFDCAHTQTVVASAGSSQADELWRIGPSIEYPHLSPNGAWLANKPKDGGIDIWSVPDRRKVVHLLDAARDLLVQFSPDSLWLAVGSPNEYVFWETDNWQPRHRVAWNNPAKVFAHVAFSPDGRIAALADSAFDIKLVDLETGLEIATLPSRQGQPQPTFCFSGDGRFLLQVGPKLVLAVWDLAEIRRRLGELKLDWQDRSLGRNGR